MRAAPVLLDTTLRPSPPMPPKALLAVLAVVLLINLSFATLFLLRGAWPITPFLGADVALLAWAFRASTLASRRSERITVTPEEFRLVRIPARGTPSALSWNPYWVRVELAEPDQHWSRLTLWSKGKGVPIAGFLPPDERVGLAESLKEALSRARDYRWQ
jgi:uncharacterized membrane protein